MLNTLAMDKTIILEQDFFTFINYISYTTVGERMTWDWVRVHWTQLVERFGTNDRNFGRLAPNIANDFKTGAEVKIVSIITSLLRIRAVVRRRLLSGDRGRCRRWRRSA
jgi:hypothetical protein